MSHLTCWSLPSVPRLKSFQLQTKARRQNSPPLFPYMQPRPQRRVVLALPSPRRARPHLHATRKPIRALPLKRLRYIPERRVLYAPAESDRQPTSDPTVHALNSRVGLQEAGQSSVERTEAAVGSMSPLASGNANSGWGRERASPDGG